MKWHLYILTAFLLSFTARSGAQTDSLPKLSDDPAISTGKLPNGINYYLASNPSSRGVISLALVRKTGSDMTEEQLRETSRDIFSRARCGKGSLENFLARNGMLPGEEGYIKCRKGSAVFTLGNFSNALGDACMDSTFFAVFGLASRIIAEGSPSSSLAVLIAGDFKRDAILAKMRTISIVTPEADGTVEDFNYVWDPSSAKGEIDVHSDAVVTLSAQWHDARVPKEYMSTALPVISLKMAEELKWILENRLYPAYRSANLPVWIDISHLDSSQSVGDDVIRLSVSCTRPLKDKVENILRTELSRLLTWGIDETEYTYARDACKYAWLYKAGRRLTNREYLQRCESAFLYGASLSTDRERLLFAYKNVPDSSQTRFFNKYMKHLIVQTAKPDSSLRRAPVLLSRTVLASFFDAYAPKEELKAPKNDKDEYMTGGVMWTFPNGVNVIYKKMATEGIMHYCYASKGGRQYADADYFSCIDGVYDENFSNFIGAYGIRIRTTFHPSDVRLDGSVPNGNFEKMLTVLAALSNQKENEKVFSPSCYKLLVLAGDMDVLQIKEILSKYVSSLGKGGRWSPVAPSDTDAESTYPPDYLLSESVFPLDLSMANQALADVAAHGLRFELGRRFAGAGVAFFQQCGFIGFPTNSYRIAYGVKPSGLENFPSSEAHRPEYEVEMTLNSLLKELAGKNVSPSDLKVFKNLAQETFKSYKDTPQYYLEIACERYLNNKDIYSKYPSCVESVSASGLKSFYAAAAAGVR